jgi:futalosine hydrolase
MKILIVAATEPEVGIFRQQLNETGDVSILITGVGGIATTYAVTKALLENTYDFVLQAGVGGSFDRDIALGELVFITSERYGDLGAEDHDKYIDIFDMGLIQADVHPHSDSKLITPHHPIHDKIQLKKATGLTINQVSGNERTIAHRNTTYNCQVESMEGAAFHYVCLQLGVPFAQVRAISNYVISRDKSQWQMKDAIVNLNKWLVGFAGNL